MFQTLRLAAELGVITTAHCENAELVGQLQQLLWQKERPGRSGMSRAAPRPLKPRGPRGLLHSWSRLARPGTWFICLCEPALRAAVEAKVRGVQLAC